MNSPYSSYVQGVSAIGPHGDRLSDLVFSVKEGTSPQIQNKKMKYFDQLLDFHVFKIPKLELLKKLPPATERRLGNLAKICFQAILRAMEDAQFEIKNPSRVGLIIGTAHGSSSLDSKLFKNIVADGGAYASPTLFTNSVHNSVSSFISLSLGISGPSTTVVSLELSTAAAIERANSWINEGVVDHVLIAVGDELYEKQIHLHYDKQKNKSHSFNPFTANQIILSEGALGLVLSKNQRSKSTNLKIESTTFSDATKVQLPNQFVLDLKGERHIKEYTSVLSNKNTLISYASQYGSYTSGGALDLAISCIGLKNSKVYASTAHCDGIPTLQEDIHDAKEIDLLQLGRQKELGWAKISLTL